MINNGTEARKQAYARHVNSPFPSQVVPVVEALGPFDLQQCFGFSVTFLLRPERAQALPPVMPHLCRRRKPDDPPSFLQSPTEIDIITRNPESLIKTADRFQTRTPHCHVASGNVLCNGVCQHHLSGPS